MTQDLRALLQPLPKVELHVHLLGTVQRATLEHWVGRERAPIRAEEIEAFYTRREKPVGVLRVLRALEAHLLRRPDDFHRLMLEYLRAASVHGVRYAECFWNPTGSAAMPGLSYAQVLPAIRQALRDAEHDHGIIGRLVPAIDREAGPQAAAEMVQWVIDHRCDDVPGIGMDYRENDHPPEQFEAAYAMARRAGLRTTAHAGEFGLPWVNVQTAIERLKVDRVDHGYTIVDHPPLLQQARERGLVFTVVPTNSYYLRTLPKQRWALDHPIRQMLAAGLRVHPNTDDPTLHFVTPTRAWSMMVAHFGASWQDLLRCVEAGLDAAWIDVSTREAWRNNWMTDWIQAEPATLL